ncbi:small subunit ribosomal protein S24e [Babesia microti strain RI]|uniref:40S ribosomal protein S24 n=1 Tax=Babesia microti (strain RI) TaxID=1133968 RepID=I7IA00_BABMR|nr:small subunit ribosomal protein S24e [Babesia microti strain RI]CCF75924.1 small subunit ribosomal protein S24e [Babesia microti strain RI]|eukprot:XP_012650332.1 small subunit ribosomal protein S24e [Babesia microti strain RI]
MDPSYSIRVRRFMTNPLLKRKQFCLEVIHPGKPCVNKEKLKEKIAKQFKISDPKTVILFGFKTLFGGGRSTGFGLIYDNIAAVKRFERTYRLVRNGLMEAPARIGRRASKELKNRRKKVRGKEKAKCSSASKKK